MKEISDILPDWSDTWTPSEAEKELPEFKFQGVGWYHTPDGNTILVTSFGTPLGRPLFRFSVYNKRNPKELFKEIFDLPSFGIFL